MNAFKPFFPFDYKSFQNTTAFDSLMRVYYQTERIERYLEKEWEKKKKRNK